MKFLVTWKVFDSFTGEAARQIRVGIGPGMQQLLASPKIKDFGLFGGVRGGYFILEVDTAEEILGTLGPEILDSGSIEVYPIATPQAVGALFGQWAEQGR